MKILYLCNYFQPMNYGENEISSSLVSLGHTVTICTGDRYFPFPDYDHTVKKLLGPRKQQTGVTKNNGVTVCRQPIVAEFAARALFFGIRKIIASLKPDLILVSGISTPTAIQAALFKPAQTRLIMIDSHLPSELSQGNSLSKHFFYLIFRLFFSSLITKKTDKFIAVQEDTAKVIKNSYGIKKPAVVISHGTNIDLFQFSRAKREKYRKELGIDKDDVVIITTGKIIPAKGVHLLFEAVSTLFKKYANIRLLVVGDGPLQYKKECLRHIPQEFQRRIHVTGVKPQSELPSYYCASDIAVWPLQESLAMNDAISCGLPVIANDKAGVKERFSNQNALLYTQGNVIDLTAKIEHLYQHSKTRTTMGKRGRELAEREMSWIFKAQKYLE